MIVSAERLSEWLKEDGVDTVVADCRFTLGKPDEGREAYAAGRLPGAVYLDLEEDLSSPVGEHGGRHPLPDLDRLAAKLGRFGIGPRTRVVAYDAQGGAMASRLWWLLRYIGHEQAYVLDGGIGAWIASGGEIETGEPRGTGLEPTVFVPRPQPHLLASVDEVRAASSAIRSGQAGAPLLIDSRERPRYLGETEPIDKLAGHIPGAVNRFWKDALDEQGRWKDAAGQAARFADLGAEPDREIIVYCGSGVTACPNVLALRQAGYRNVRLYAGSWSDWISYPDNPIATGEEKK
ncbi:sulfurtransferase [Paenibacillus thermoaerophilus]|uniref:Sulfurtransferase n=1 Tax=Paenibacillus thermoaerophilus TaxID=1215385 RepID=A0ABW2UZG4_9BACL|nr:sulfurtransferase [Paenibacillus thermoaerophilus]TMV14387.1 sulfurtransferase [Paenibacillus thermoaerophilus]